MSKAYVSQALGYRTPAERYFGQAGSEHSATRKYAYRTYRRSHYYR